MKSTQFSSDTLAQRSPLLAPAAGASRHLLVPLSGRVDARHAQRYARELVGKGFSVSITWLCVVGEEVVLHQFDGDDQVLADEYRAAYLLTAATMLVEGLGVESQSLIRYGDKVFNILDCCEEIGCDEIVIYGASQPRLPANVIARQRRTGTQRVPLVLLKSPSRVRSSQGVWRFWMRAISRDVRRAVASIMTRVSAKVPMLARLQRQ